MRSTGMGFVFCDKLQESNKIFRLRSQDDQFDWQLLGNLNLNVSKTYTSTDEQLTDMQHTKFKLHVVTCV